MCLCATFVSITDDQESSSLPHFILKQLKLLIFHYNGSLLTLKAIKQVTHKVLIDEKDEINKKLMLLIYYGELKILLTHIKTGVFKNYCFLVSL